MNEPISTSEVVPEETPQMGMVARFVGVFTSPRRSFASIKRNHEWLAAILVVLIFGMGSYALTRPYIIKGQLATFEERLDANSNMPEAQKQEILDGYEEQISNPVWLLLGPVFLVIVALIASAILLFLGNIVLGGQAKFLTVLNMYCLTFLVGVPETIIKLPMILSKKSIDVKTSLGLLASSESVGPFMSTILDKFDIFAIWQVALVSIGLSVLTKTSVGKSATVVVIVWLLWVIIQAGLATLGVNFGGM